MERIARSARLELFSGACWNYISVHPNQLSPLASHGVAHVYNHWSYMPSLADQHTKMERFTAPFAVLRLLTPFQMSYEAARKRAEPYSRIVGELPDMRQEAVLLVKNAIGHNRPAYVLVNNRLEGIAPLTVQALTDLLR